MGNAAANSNNSINLQQTWNISHSVCCINDPLAFQQDLYSNYENVVPPVYAYALSDHEWKELLSDWKRYTDLTSDRNKAILDAIHKVIRTQDFALCGTCHTSCFVTFLPYKKTFENIRRNSF